MRVIIQIFTLLTFIFSKPNKKSIWGNSLVSGSSSESHKRCRGKTNVHDEYNDHIFVRKCQVLELSCNQVPGRIVLSGSFIAMCALAESKE